MPNPNQEPPASSSTQNQNLKDMDVLYTLNINLESQNLDQGYIKVQELHRNHEPQVLSSSQNQDFEDMDSFATSKSIQISKLKSILCQSEKACQSQFDLKMSI